MKLIYLVLLTAFISTWAFAHEAADTTKIDTEHEGTTTIRVDKTPKGEIPPGYPQKVKWEIHDGSADIEGEASATGRDAKKAWQKACDDWKKEIREDNKENKLMSVNCGISSCSGDAGSKVCSSKGTYKVKTKMEE